MDTLVRPGAAPVQVICLGYSRTGTTSLSAALDILGFGPCYHMFAILQRGGNDYPAWFNLSDGTATPEDLDAVLQNYRSVLDQPPAIFPAEMYAAYPDAKFILTTRDPVTWEKSMKATLLPAIKELAINKNRTPIEEYLAVWNEHHLAKYHCNRLFIHTQEELLRHNERVKKIVPPDKLLVYDVGEGWTRLVEFLEVPNPNIPFPHLNDTAQFLTVVKGLGVSE